MGSFCARCVEMFVLFIMGGCLVLLFFFGFSVVKEYQLSKDTVAVECEVTEILDKGSQECNYCKYNEDGESTTGGSCTSHFPCVTILVKFQAPSGGETGTGILYTSALKAHDSEFNHCSFRVCKDLVEINTKYLEALKEPYIKYLNNNSTFQCFHGPENPEILLTEMHYSGRKVFHAMFWPSLVFVLCGIGLTVCCIRRKRKSKYDI